MTAPIPDLTTPLIPDGGGENNSTILKNLGALAGLIGTWNSPTGADATGYNVMPLPADNVQPQGYLLKNFFYYEELTFSVPQGTAPNRGGDFQQNCYILFYEQRVYFAENPAVNMLVHAENGTWLHLVYDAQPAGAYAPPTLPPPTQMQPANVAYVKQVSVPHGNSILATGGLKTYNHAPTAADYPTADRSMLPFTDPSVKDPNTVLMPALTNLVASKGTRVSKTDQIQVSTANDDGQVTNITFEKGHADVTGFDTTFYIVTLANGEVVLQYSQTIAFDLLINGKLTPFLHIDANTLTKVD
jgi:hypothetical protein